MRTVHLKTETKSRKAWVDGKELDLARSLTFRRHSPTGFSHGYGGSGPAQLALAILLECVSKKEALNNYQDFKWEVIAQLPFGKDIDMYIDIPDYEGKNEDQETSEKGAKSPSNRRTGSDNK